jgi:hypothetical protein
MISDRNGDVVSTSVINVELAVAANDAICAYADIF